MPSRYAEALLNERHLIDFAQRCGAHFYLGQAAVAKRNHTLLDGRALDFGCGAAVHNHFADVIGQVQELADGGPAVIAGAGAFEAACAFGKTEFEGARRIDAAFAQFLRGKFLRALAIFANEANQALGHDAIQSGNEIVGLDSHVDETADDVGHVVGVDGSEHQVPGERGLNGDLRGFLVADFADHDFVRVVAEDGAQTAGEGKTLFFVDGNLGDAAKLVLDGVFDRDDFVFVGLDFVDGGVERGGFAGTGRAGDQHHAVRLANVAAEAAGFFGREADDIEAETLEFFGESFLVQHAKNGVFAMAGGHNGDAQVNVAAFVLHAEAAVLWDAPFGDVQIAENLDAGKNGGVPFLGNGLHGVLKNAVDAVLDGDFGVAGLDVNITGAACERGEDDGFDEANHRADGGIARQAVTGDGLFAFLFFIGDLKGEGFGGLLENALGLLGALQEVADLARRGNLDGQFLSEKER